MSKDRWYVHGDTVEGDSGMFFCARCDEFLPVGGLRDGSGCMHDGRAEDVRRAQRDLKTAKKFIRGGLYRRPDSANATNYFL